MNPKEVLENLGLEEKEINIYLTLLELGESSVLSISRRSGVKRPTVYVVLRSLEEKGYVSRVIKGRKATFSAQHPRKLVSETEFHLKELQQVMPQLEGLFHQKKGKPRIMIFEGQEALDRAYDDAFITKGDLMYMGTLGLSMKAFPKTYRKVNYVSHSSEFNIKELIDENEESRKYAEIVRSQYREVRFIAKEFLPFEVDIGVFGNRTLITSVKREYFTISIESKEISNAFKKLFKAMWKLSKE